MGKGTPAAGPTLGWDLQGGRLPVAYYPLPFSGVVMRRLLLLLALACSDPTSPAERPTDCWAYITLAFTDEGERHVWQFWFHFDTCPSREWLSENGWKLGINPAFGNMTVATEPRVTTYNVMLSDSSSGHED